MATVLSPLPALLVLRANCRMALARISHLRAQQSHFGGLQWMLRSRVHAVAFAHPVPVGSAMSIAVPRRPIGSSASTYSYIALLSASLEGTSLPAADEHLEVALGIRYHPLEAAIDRALERNAIGDERFEVDLATAQELDRRDVFDVRRMGERSQQVRRAPVLTGYSDWSRRVSRERLLASSRAGGIRHQLFASRPVLNRARVRGVPPLEG